MTAELEDWLRGILGTNVVVDPLHGDVSGRLFWRVFSNRETFILMDSRRTPLWPWLDIHGLLSERDFPVPTMISSESERGWALQEDLGDTRLLDTDDDSYMNLLDNALGLLNRMQRELDPETCRGSVAGKRSFTSAFYMAELDQTLECLFFTLLEVGSEDLLLLQGKMRELCGMLGEGSVFTHRDYHSANLMVRDGSLWMVDWQDARLGPAEYDLVSLLRDSYRDIGDEWEGKARRFTLSRGDSNIFRVAMSACQRSIKAAGSLAHHFRATGDRSYINHLPRTFRYLDGYAGLCPQLRDLVNEVYRVLDENTGRIDLRDFRDSDVPLVTEGK